MTRFVTSDHHFQHANIMDYCDRPFEKLDDMHDVMRERWAAVVNPRDVIVYGGDIAMGTGEEIIEIVTSLPGEVVYLLGNHDDSLDPESAPFPVVESLVIQNDGYRFWYTHRPDTVPDAWTEWVLHGHTHNDDPFIHYDTRRVNVSVENTQYAPVSVPAVTKALGSMGNGDVADTITESPIVHHQWWQELDFLLL
jgi:calcineurin-like phosphoesterase family protein